MIESSCLSLCHIVERHAKGCALSRPLPKNRGGKPAVLVLVAAAAAAGIQRHPSSAARAAWLSCLDCCLWTLRELRLRAAQSFWSRNEAGGAAGSLLLKLGPLVRQGKSTWPFGKAMLPGSLSAWPCTATPPCVPRRHPATDCIPHLKCMSGPLLLDFLLAAATEVAALL